MKNNFDWDEFFTGLIKILFGLLIVGFFIFYIYVLVTYGDKPISEAPTWVWWLLGGSK